MKTLNLIDKLNENMKYMELPKETIAKMYADGKLSDTKINELIAEGIIDEAVGDWIRGKARGFATGLSNLGKTVAGAWKGQTPTNRADPVLIDRMATFGSLQKRLTQTLVSYVNDIKKMFGPVWAKTPAPAQEQINQLVTGLMEIMQGNETLRASTENVVKTGNFAEAPGTPEASKSETPKATAKAMTPATAAAPAMMSTDKGEEASENFDNLPSF